MWNSTKALYQYHSAFFPTFKFFYVPLTRREQERFQQKYSQYATPYGFMREVLRDQLVLISEDTVWNTFRYSWPEEEDFQNHLLGRIPPELVVELGARVLGWTRYPEEDRHLFVERVLGASTAE